jgi:hypothetical protein
LANRIIDRGEIYLNGYKYKINGPVQVQSIDPFPDPIRFGDASYDNKSHLSSWPIKCIGGIGNENFRTDEPDKIWWTNCITEYPGHILPPRLATKITIPTITAPTLLNGSFEDWTGDTPDNWNETESEPASSADWNIDEDAVKIKVGSSSVRFHADNANAGSGSSHLTLTSDAISVSGSQQMYLGYFVYPDTRDDGTGTIKVKIINNDSGETEDDISSLTLDAWHWRTISHTAGAGTATITIQIKMTVTAFNNIDWDYYFDQFVFGDSNASLLMANFNGEKYLADGNILYKLASGRASYEFVTIVPADITALVPSLDSKLYIFQGDTEEYMYMDTSEVLYQSDEYGDKAWQFDNKLLWATTDGVVQYAADPDNAAVTESACGTITDIADQIERFFVGRDAVGSTVSYCTTNSILKVLDIDTPEWLDTEVRLPSHPNGGKGACYYNGRIYISYGLGVKEYNPETGFIQDIGLTERDGLPSEYNGEIVFLLGDSASKGMFALVDASQTSGNSLSGLYKWHDGAWYCWWIDTVNNQAMTECIVSSAESGYAIYWGCGGDVYYIDIPRGVQNPDKISQYYATSGSLLTSWFDGGSISAAKLAKYLTDFARGISTTETIVVYYRIDKIYTNIATGWSGIINLNTVVENGAIETSIPSGATAGTGISFQAIQFKFDFVTTGSTNKPDIQDLTLWFKKSTGSEKQRGWTVPIIVKGDGRYSAKQKWANLETARVSDADVVFSFHGNDAGDEEYYVDVDYTGVAFETGRGYQGTATLTLIES